MYIALVPPTGQGDHGTRLCRVKHLGLHSLNLRRFKAHPLHNTQLRQVHPRGRHHLILWQRAISHSTISRYKMQLIIGWKIEIKIGGMNNGEILFVGDRVRWLFLTDLSVPPKTKRMRYHILKLFFVSNWKLKKCGDFVLNFRFTSLPVIHRLNRLFFNQWNNYCMQNYRTFKKNNFGGTQFFFLHFFSFYLDAKNHFVI